MLPTVEEICTKDIVTIGINRTLEEAVKVMTKRNVRSILVVSNSSQEYFILTVNDTISYRINNIPLKAKLCDLPLKEAKQIDAKINILEIINQENEVYEYMVVVFENKLIGIISQTDIINNIDPQILMQKQSVGNLILQYTAMTIYQDESALNAIKIMETKHIDSLLVVDDTQNPIGIFTTKDFLTIISNNSNLKLPIKEYMSTPLETVPTNITIADAIRFIQKKHFKRIVITDTKGKVSGVITQTELLRLLNNKWIEIIRQRGTELSIINKKLIERTASLEEKASTDFLTKLYNRRKFDSLIEYEIKQIQRYNDKDLSLILLDIDGFKYINDSYGHDVGDIILKDIAKIIKLSIRESDVSCRWGGEEFAICLSHTDINDSLLVAQKIRQTIESFTFTQELKITCSFGVSQLHSADTYIELFKRADEALYKAKNNGKNRVEIEHI
ncbi:MAG: diguanylate cyclase [Arcobacteraceae bacterium]|nr:diguanylate cyclase [Arcobacteraceae bacterium]